MRGTHPAHQTSPGLSEILTCTNLHADFERTSDHKAELLNLPPSGLQQCTKKRRRLDDGSKCNGTNEAAQGFVHL